MKISGSTIAMEANSSYSSSGLSLHVIKDMTRDEAASLKISDTGRSYLTLLSNGKDPGKRSQNKMNEAKAAKGLLEMTKRTSRSGDAVAAEEEESPEIRALRYILEMMKRWAKGDYSTVSIDLMNYKHDRSSSSFSAGVSDGSSFTMFSREEREESFFAGVSSVKALDMRSPVSREAGTGRLMTRVTASYNVVNESEAMNFKTVGTALTEDGRKIDFNAEFGMSRHFSVAFQSLQMEDYTAALCDPLVINVGADTVDIADQKFFFDLDGDGNIEEISGLGKGSGFLALDKDGDGKISNGKELFGTGSGDGFKDLSIYDSDLNGWIDESDPVFDRLKIWYKNGSGEDRLLSLRDAGVGAIYLGNVSVDFSDKNQETGDLNGIIRKTGIFLRENGGVGTIQHVDLAL